MPRPSSTSIPWSGPLAKLMITKWWVVQEEQTNSIRIRDDFSSLNMQAGCFLCTTITKFKKLDGRFSERRKQEQQSKGSVVVPFCWYSFNSSSEALQNLPNAFPYPSLWKYNKGNLYSNMYLIGGIKHLPWIFNSIVVFIFDL